MISTIRIALLAVCLVPTAVQAHQSEQIRTICKTPALQERILARASKGERRDLESELENRCAQVDLPAEPLNRTAGASPESSHINWVYDARYSLDGRRIVSASRDGTVRVWDAETGAPILKIAVAEVKGAPGRREGYVRSATFVGDGLVAVAADGNPARLFDVATAKAVADLPFAATQADAFTPKLLATRSLLFVGGFNDRVDVMDAGTRAMRYRLAGHGAEASAIAVSETADLVATGASNDFARPPRPAPPRVQLWRLSTGDKLGEFVPTGDPRPAALAFSRDGAQLAVVMGGVVHVYNVADRRLVRTLEVHHMAHVFGVAFTADGK